MKTFVHSFVLVLIIVIVFASYWHGSLEQNKQMAEAYLRDRQNYENYLARIPKDGNGAKEVCENEFNGVFRLSNAGIQHPMPYYRDPVPFGAWCKVEENNFLHEYLMQKYKDTWKLTTKENTP